MQGRKALPVPQPVADPTIPEAFDRLNDSAAQLAATQQAQQQAADTLAIEFGYAGAVTVGRLEDEIRFYHIRMRSLHPNHVHQIDPSLCLVYYMGGEQRVMHESEFNKNKPAAMDKVLLKAGRL